MNLLFTNFNSYDRSFTLLEGEIDLKINNNNNNTKLITFNPIFFFGDDTVISYGKYIYIYIYKLI